MTHPLHFPPAPGATVDGAVARYLALLRPNVKRSTLAIYRAVSENHIHPTLGSAALRRVTAAQINDYVGSQLRDGAVSAATARSVVRILTAALQCAGCRDVAAGIVRPPQARTGALRAPRVLSDADWRALRTYLLRRGDGPALGVLLDLYTGLRIGELCALRWGDIDLSGGLLQVRRTVQRIAREGGGAKTEVIFDAPKTASGRRAVPLPEFLRELLRERVCPPACYLLTGRADRFLEPRTMEARFKTMLRAAGVADINFHALRHSFATRCVDAGVDIKALSMLLGHADVNVTLNTYVHPSAEKLRRSVELLAASVPIGDGEP